ncbi:hypothetical protein pb186bvf_020306 [Paramecium bursaria]
MNKLDRVLIKYGVLDRCQQLINQCPQEDKNKYQDCVADVKEIIRAITRRSFYYIYQFAATRGFEGYDKYTNQKNEIKPFFKTDPYKENFQCVKLLTLYVENPPTILKFFDEGILQEAKIKFCKDKLVLNNLCQYKVRQDQINKFFEENQVFYFEDQGQGLRGLSSFDGKTTYININQTRRRQRNSLLHEWSHNFPRFLWKNRDPLHISPKKNKNLRLFVPEMNKIVEFEAGEYFDHVCLKKTDLSYSPFALLIDR